MANNTNIRQKLIDILFEPEPDIEDRPYIAPNEPVELVEVKEEKKAIEDISAKELLYNQQENSSKAFIDYEESEKTFSSQNEEFVPSQNISPIFGPIITRNKKENSADAVANKSATDGSNSSYFQTVLSPIYGFDEKRANEARSSINRTPTRNYTNYQDIFEDDNNNHHTEDIDLFSDL